MMKPAIALWLSLAAPFSVSLADDELTQELHGNSFQEASTSLNCDAVGSCRLSFPPTQHVNTVVTNVNCWFAASPGAQVAFAEIYSANNQSVAMNVPINFLGNDGNLGTALVVNSQVNYFIKQGDTPIFWLALFNGSVLDLRCAISGYHS